MFSALSLPKDDNQNSNIEIYITISLIFKLNFLHKIIRVCSTSRAWPEHLEKIQNIKSAIIIGGNLKETVL